jgi:ATP-dependent protease ClpP protease subunit
MDEKKMKTNQRDEQMTTVKQRLEEILNKRVEGELMVQDIIWLTTQLESHMEKLAVAKLALELTVKHYEHPMHDHNWAYYLFEKHVEALKQIGLE